MDAAASKKREKLRVPVDAPWLLGNDAECVIDGPAVTLCDEGSGALVRLLVFNFEGRSGRVLRFCSRVRPMGRHSIDFAGLGRDAWYEVACADEATAEMAAARIEAIVAGIKRSPGDFVLAKRPPRRA